jgi:phosphoglycerate dehydrogenase-like enzyme
MAERAIGVVIHTKLRDRIISKEDRERLDSLGEVRWTDSPEPITVEEAVAILRGCEVGVGSWGTPYPTKELLDGAPDLRLWEHVAGTVKMMFGPHLEGRHLTIASCKTAIADCVAEMALAEIILGLRRAFENASANRSGPAGKPANVKVLYGSTVGVVAASEVGRRVTRMLGPFGARILLYDPYVTEDAARGMGAELVRDLVDLCRRSDAVTLHTPMLPSTEKMLGREHFRAMKDDAVFVNTSRGGCVDEAALVAELEKGRLFGLLDVSDPEPPAPESPLRSLPNVVYTSHIAGPASFNMGRQAVDDIAAFLSGGSPMCVVKADDLDRCA